MPRQTRRDSGVGPGTNIFPAPPGGELSVDLLRVLQTAERRAQIVYWAGDRPVALAFLRAGPEAEGSWYSQRPVLLPSGCLLGHLRPPGFEEVWV